MALSQKKTRALIKDQNLQMDFEVLGVPKREAQEIRNIYFHYVQKRVSQEEPVIESEEQKNMEITIEKIEQSYSELVELRDKLLEEYQDLIQNKF